MTYSVSFTGWQDGEPHQIPVDEVCSVLTRHGCIIYPATTEFSLPYLPVKRPTPEAYFSDDARLYFDDNGTTEFGFDGPAFEEDRGLLFSLVHNLKFFMMPSYGETVYAHEDVRAHLPEGFVSEGSNIVVVSRPEDFLL